MRRFMDRLLLTLLVSVSFLNHAAAQGPLDVLPQDAALALSIYNIEALMKKGDKFIADTEIDVPLRPSQLFVMANQFLGVRQGLDKKGSAAIFLMRPEKGEERLGFNNLNEILVPAIPFTDADEMAANFGL